jgi:hypothetical protein
MQVSGQYWPRKVDAGRCGCCTLVLHLRVSLRDSALTAG